MLKQLIDRWVKPKVREWLETRALVLPENVVQEISQRLRLSPNKVRAVHQAIREFILQEFDKLF